MRLKRPGGKSKLDGKPGRKPKMTPELSDALTPEYVPAPPCSYCGAENKAPHFCVPLQERNRRILLGCTMLPDEHFEDEACTSTCAVNKMVPGEKFNYWSSRRRNAERSA